VSAARVCVCTISLARDAHERRLIHSTLNHLSRGGLPVFVADGGSPADFVAGIAALPDVTVVGPAQRGLVAQVQAAFAAARARDAAFLLYLEADKALFASEHLADFVDRAAADPDAGVVLAARSDRSFATFPAAQRAAESRINEMTGAVTARPGDYSYGPFMLDGQLAPYVALAPAALGWGWRHFMFGIAHRLGRRLLHITGDYDCPLDQRREDEGERQHRERQLAQNISGLELSITMRL
jgi:CTP:molybdopterin cytidylyltransferase MocA